MDVTFVSWMPPNGDEIVFRGVAETADGLRSGLFAISPDGGEPRALTPTDGHPDDGYQGPTPSPDGRHLLYQSWDRVAERMHFRVLDLATGCDEEVGPTGARFGEGDGMYSPDGKLIAYRGFGGTSLPAVRGACRRECRAARADRVHARRRVARVLAGRHEGDAQPVRQSGRF